MIPFFKKAVLEDKDKFESVSISLPPGKYNLLVGGKNLMTHVEFPADIIFTSVDNWYDNYQYPALYFFVPSDVEQVVYWDEHGPGQNRKGYWINPDGKRIEPIQLTNKVYKINVEEKYKRQSLAIYCWAQILQDDQYTSQIFAFTF
ncbi:MAG: hypothetical protein NVV59_19870 [Chitinophagaceae bacterium]|nr:hypothetical protein [Chitinophagaceae bacterium]